MTGFKSGYAGQAWRVTCFDDEIGKRRKLGWTNDKPCPAFEGMVAARPGWRDIEYVFVGETGEPETEDNVGSLGFVSDGPHPLHQGYRYLIEPKHQGARLRFYRDVLPPEHQGRRMVWVEDPQRARLWVRREHAVEYMRRMVLDGHWPEFDEELHIVEHVWGMTGQQISEANETRRG